MAHNFSSDEAAFAAIGSAEPPTGTVAGLGTAVVMGGSIAGMLAARVLADHAESVVIIERDSTPDGPRRGVPQGTQIHALLAGGLRQFERWFPGFADRAVAAGAIRVQPHETGAYDNGMPKVEGLDIPLLTATRPFLEQRVRAELQAVANVKTVAGRVTGLEFGGTAVTGVRWESDGVAGVEPADLVVDALGRASKVSDWLEAAGWDRPPMTRVATGINYATALFHRPPGTENLKQALALNGTQGGLAASGATYCSVEGDRYLVMMGGYGDFRPGSTNEDLIERARRDFPAPFGRAVEHGIIGDVATYRQSDSRRRDWGGCERLPARLLPVGDAAASFNPLYGQGMSSACLHASALSMWLRGGPELDAPARGFLELQRVVVDAAWAVSAAGDEARNRTPGPVERLSTWVVGKVVAASVVDRQVNRVFAEVTQMLRHPAALSRPAVLWRSLLAAFRSRPALEPPLEPRTTSAR